MLIHNRESILENGSTRHKEIALDLFEEGIKAVLPERVIAGHLGVEGEYLLSGDKRYNLADINRVIVIGGGKASFGMAKALEASIGSVIDTGLVVTKRGNKKGNIEKIQVFEAAHPVPDNTGLDAAGKLLDVASSAKRKDLVIFLISGGGSALLTLPIEGIKLDDLKRLTENLLASGASIGEINKVRKRLSKIKGGRLAKAIHPAKCLTLIISDVVGDELSHIASGPTVPEGSVPEDALRILDKYDLMHRHERVAEFIHSSKPETEPVNEEEFSGFNVTNQVVASNTTALSAMASKAEEQGIYSIILSSMLEGESREVGSVFGQLARSVFAEGRPIQMPALLLSGGETTVSLTKNSGKGGPNQEFALAGGREIQGIQNSLVGAIDSDGEDGSTELAGGLVTGESGVSEDHFHSYLKNHNSSNLLYQIDGAINTGQTGTNVNDLRLALLL